MKHFNLAFRANPPLARVGRSGALVFAEHAVDLHLAPLTEPHEWSVALDALMVDLIAIGSAEPDLARFLDQGTSHVAWLRRSNETSAATP